MKCKNINDQITPKNKIWKYIVEGLEKGLNVQRSPENHINID